MFPVIKYNKLQRKNVFMNDYFGSQSFFISYNYIKTFVHLLIFAAVSNFSVFKLIRRYSENIYLFKVNSGKH